jgi:hypothetical protein
LRQHASTHSSVDTLGKILAQPSCVTVSENRNDACETVEACNDSQECVIARVIPDVEARLKHETICNNRVVGATTSFKAKPRVAVIARLAEATALAHAAATDVRLTCHVEKLHTLLIREATWAAEALATCQ